jgi:hypothetical protein
VIADNGRLVDEVADWKSNEHIKELINLYTGRYDIVESNASSARM